MKAKKMNEALSSGSSQVQNFSLLTIQMSACLQSLGSDVSKASAAQNKDFTTPSPHAIISKTFDQEQLSLSPLPYRLGDLIEIQIQPAK